MLDFIAGSVATRDSALPLDILALGLHLGDVQDLLLQVSGATIAIGDARLQPVTVTGSSTLMYDRANMGRLHVRSNVAGVPGTVSFTAWKVK